MARCFDGDRVRAFSHPACNPSNHQAGRPSNLGGYGTVRSDHPLAGSQAWKGLQSASPQPRDITFCHFHGLGCIEPWMVDFAISRRRTNRKQLFVGYFDYYDLAISALKKSAWVSDGWAFDWGHCHRA